MSCINKFGHTKPEALSPPTPLVTLRPPPRLRVPHHPVHPLTPLLAFPLPSEVKNVPFRAFES